MAVPSGPGEEGADGKPLVGAAGVVVGVDVGLGECRRADPDGDGPGQERLSLGEAALGVLAGGGRQRAGGGAGAHRGEPVPLPELAQQPQVGVIVQGVEAPGQPRLVVAELPVGGGQGAAVDEQFPQVGNGAGAGPGVKRLMGQRQRAGGEGGEQVPDVRLTQPVERGGRAGGGGQGAGEGLERRADRAGPVVEQPFGGPGDGAGVAEPGQSPAAAGGHAGLGAAAQAAELAGDPGAAAADRGAVAQADQRPVSGAAVGARAGELERGVHAPEAQVPFGERRGGPGEVPAPGAGPFLAGAGHFSGRSLARAGRSAFRSVTPPSVLPLAVRRRAGTFSARVAISCAGVTSRMSHSAARTGSDSRSGTWVTSRQTCTDDRVMPRSASSGSRSEALNSPAAARRDLPGPLARLRPGSLSCTGKKSPGRAIRRLGGPE